MPYRDSRESSDRTLRPAVDEWGIYDPSQAGLAALFERLETKQLPPSNSEAVAVASSMRNANRFSKR